LTPCLCPHSCAYLKELDVQLKLGAVGLEGLELLDEIAELAAELLCEHLLLALHRSLQLLNLLLQRVQDLESMPASQ
jgi:hypothetical protein